MHVLDFLHESKDWTVRIPIYHRGHLSLRPGTTVHLMWVVRPETESRGAGVTSGLPELFGTTVRTRTWPSAYRIWIALYDAPGVLNKALHSISRHGGNVLQLDSTSTERETHHDVEMIVDFASLVDTDEPIRDLSPEIEGLLLADCAQHIVSDSEGGFLLSVRPISSLRRMNRVLLKIRGRDPLSTFRVAKKGFFALDEGFRSMLRDAGVDIPFNYLVTSDTTDRVFRITFFPATQPVVWCSIRHADVKGALESITDALKRNDITILCSLNRVQEHLGKNWFEAVLSSPTWRVTRSTSAHVPPTEFVRHIMNDPELQAYDLRLFFEPEDAKEAMETDTTETNHGQAYADQREDVDRWLTAKEADLATIESELQRTDSRDGYREAAALRAGIKKVRQETARLKRKVFISVEFTDENELKIAAAEVACRKMGFTPIVVRTPKDQRIIWEGVIERMRDCTDFVGIWTPSSKTLESKRPSPWCVWELGIANALGLRTYVFGDLNADLTDYRAIHGTEFYYKFKTALEFDEHFSEVMQDIARRSNVVTMKKSAYPGSAPRG